MSRHQNINIFIISTDSLGLVVDSKVLAYALTYGSALLKIKTTIYLVHLNPKQINKSDNSVMVDFPEDPHIIIYIEQIYKISDQRSTEAVQILVPNPEWMSPITGEMVSGMWQIWHKTKYSTLALSMAFPQQNHAYIGFTTMDPEIKVNKNRNFAHFKGKSVTRNSDKILNIWRKRPELPSIKIQFFTNSLEADFFDLPEWLNWKNIYVKLGKIPSDAYFSELSANGIHLCTSEVEGFGHYLNESRAMEAAIVCVDAPPMNELVDSESSVLIKPIGSVGMSLGTRYLISEDGIQQAVDRLLSLNDDEFKLLGQNARKRYEKDHQDFLVRLQFTFSKLVEENFGK